MEKVSVIIPSYNRFKYLLHAVRSATEQTYTNLEVIIVNDCSTEDEYYTYDFKSLGTEVYIIHLPKNSRTIFGKVCGGGNARNIGMMACSGKYIAFLDDDDYFLPTKIEKQMDAMRLYNCDMSCTEAYGGRGLYSLDKTSEYEVWHHMGIHWEILERIFNNQGKLHLLYSMYDNSINVWGAEEINAHNCTCGGSSILIARSLIDQAGYFPLMEYAEDWAYWKKLIQHSKCVFMREPLTYLDRGHGYRINYDKP